MQQNFTEKSKILFFKLLPYFLAFIIGSFFGTSSTLYSIDQDCRLMGKTRMGDKVFSCEKK